MKRISCLFSSLLLLLFSQLSLASTLTGSTLWKIEKQVGSKQVSNYVFGTVHLPDLRVANFPLSLQSSLDQVNTIVLEVILDPETMQQLAQRMQAKSGRGIDSILTQQQLEKLQTALVKRNLSINTVKHLKPWLIATQLMLPAHSAANASLTLEMQLSEYANARNAKLAQLESADEQLDLFDTLPESEQIELLMSSVNSLDKVDDLTEVLMQAYLQGNLEKIIEMNDKLSAEEKNPRLQDLMTKLVQKRNQLMFQRMQKYIQKGHTMIAVGALHLAGEEGLLNLLQQQGWTVTPLPMKW